MTRIRTKEDIRRLSLAFYQHKYRNTIQADFQRKNKDKNL